MTDTPHVLAHLAQKTLVAVGGRLGVGCGAFQAVVGNTALENLYTGRKESTGVRRDGASFSGSFREKPLRTVPLVQTTAEMHRPLPFASLTFTVFA